MKAIRCKVHNIDFKTSCPACMADAMCGQSLSLAPGWPGRPSPPPPDRPADPGVSYIGEAPVGAKLMAFGDKVFMVATGMAPHWVTPTGLVLMQRADGGE